MNRLAPFVLLFASACYQTDPTLLADFGDASGQLTSFTVDGVPSEVRVDVQPAEGCPTFGGEAIAQGEPMTLESEGVAYTMPFALGAPSTCQPPAYTWSGLTPAEAEDVAVELKDSSATWRIGEPGSTELGWATLDDATVPSGATLSFALFTGDHPDVTVVAESATVSRGYRDFAPPVAWDEALEVYTLPLDTRLTGPITVTLTAELSFAPTVCEGFDACSAVVQVQDRFNVQVEAPKSPPV